MRTFDELQQSWAALAPSPSGRGSVVALTVRVDDGVNELRPELELTRELGVVGDRWSRVAEPPLERQVSLINARVAELIGGDQPLSTAGNNLVVDLDLSEAACPVGTRLRVGTALIEVSPYPHTGCDKFSARFGAAALRWANHKDLRAQRFRGLYATVIEPGTIKTGDSIAIAE